MSQTLSSDTDADPDPVQNLAYVNDLLAEALAWLNPMMLSDAVSVAVLDGLEQLGRRVDGARVAVTTDVARRADLDCADIDGTGPGTGTGGTGGTGAAAMRACPTVEVFFVVNVKARSAPSNTSKIAPTARIISVLNFTVWPG